MDWWLASFFLGAILSLFLPIVPEIFALFSLLLLSITLFYFKPLRLSSSLLLGTSWMLFSAFQFKAVWQDNNLNLGDLAQKSQLIQGETLSLQATSINKIKNAKESTENTRVRFNLRVSQLNQQPLKKPIVMRLSWDKPNITIQQGQILQLKVKFKPTHGLANLGGFSYQTWLNSKNISATGYVLTNKANKILVEQRSVRQQLFNKYAQILPEHKLSPLLLALGFGSRSQLNMEQNAPLWQVLQSTGTGHLIAISGLHIGLVATASYFFVMLVIRLFPLPFLASSNIFQGINIRYLAIIISMLAALLYGYLAGFSLPTVRALLMLSIYWLSRILSIKVSVKRWLLLTLFIITLVTPFSLFSASFWLSVYAVSVIFVTLWRFKSSLKQGSAFWRFIKGLLVIQLSLTFMLWPISAIFFQQISLVSLFANMVAVPWMSFVSIPLCLLSVFFTYFSEALGQLFILLCLESLQYLWLYLSFLSEQSWAVLKLSSVDIQLFVMLGLLVTFVVFFTLSFKPQKLLMRVLMLATLLIVVIWPLRVLNYSYAIKQGNGAEVDQNLKSEQSVNWQLVVFDVGQGLAVLLQNKQQAILYDTGAAYGSGFNMVDAVILPYLQHQGIEVLDKVIISHSDNDHAGGLILLQSAIPINELIVNNGINQQTCQQGKSFSWHNLNITMLWPKEALGEENDDSCVLLISDGKHKVLLTGDISKKVEAKLLEQYPQLQADVLVVPHHGSKTSSSDAFISHVIPKLAIVSAGFLNRWHMPVPEVIERYQSKNTQLINSAETGQIIINFSNKGINKQTYHNDLWPFWFAK